jgi:hypothetical protein
MLGIEHGTLTYFLYLESDRGTQGAGGVGLGSYAKCGEYLMELLATVGVQYWNDLEGTTVRFTLKNGVVDKIGHIIKDRWFTIVREDG